MDCAPEWAPGRESSLRSAGWASKGSGEALHLAVGRHVRARKLPLELVWIKNHPDDGSTSVYCSTDEKCRLTARGESAESSTRYQIMVLWPGKRNGLEDGNGRCGCRRRNCRAARDILVYERLNGVLEKAVCGAFDEGLCGGVTPSGWSGRVCDRDGIFECCWWGTSKSSNRSGSVGGGVSQCT